MQVGDAALDPHFDAMCVQRAPVDACSAAVDDYSVGPTELAGLNAFARLTAGAAAAIDFAAQCDSLPPDDYGAPPGVAAQNVVSRCVQQVRPAASPYEALPYVAVARPCVARSRAVPAQNAVPVPQAGRQVQQALPARLLRHHVDFGVVARWRLAAWLQVVPLPAPRLPSDLS
ncbi:MAG: hypothetical protein WAL03_13030 [Pseudolabrys sp.]|jgi:hypothetical protein